MRKFTILVFSVYLFLLGEQVHAQFFWEDVGWIGQSDLYTLYPDSVSGFMFIGGKIPATGGATTKGFSYYADTGFVHIPNTIDISPSRTFTRYKGDLFVGGNGGIKVWHGGDSVSIPGEGIQGVASHLMVFDDTLYTYGQIAKAGQVDIVNNMAKWDGSQWSEITNHSAEDDGFNIAGIATAAFYKSDLYIGGIIFDEEGNCSILKWDGEIFSLPSNGIRGTFAEVQSMIVWNDTLYVAGLFEKTDGNAGNCIMKWDGDQWHDVGGGITEGLRINEIKVIDNKLYAVGTYFEIGGVEANSLAYWNSNEWCALGSEFNNSVADIAILNEKIWVAGVFTMIDSTAVSSIARWTGGDHTDTCGNIVANTPEVKEDQGTIRAFPNPTSQNVRLQFSGNTKEQLSIFNIHGKLVRQETVFSNDPIDVEDFETGIYILSVRDKHIKLIKQ